MGCVLQIIRLTAVNSISKIANLKYWVSGGILAISIALGSPGWSAAGSNTGVDAPRHGGELVIGRLGSPVHLNPDGKRFMPSFKKSLSMICRLFILRKRHT